MIAVAVEIVLEERSLSQRSVLDDSTKPQMLAPQFLRGSARFRKPVVLAQIDCLYLDSDSSGRGTGP